MGEGVGGWGVFWRGEEETLVVVWFPSTNTSIRTASSAKDAATGVLPPLPSRRTKRTPGGIGKFVNINVGPAFVVNDRAVFLPGHPEDF